MADEETAERGMVGNAVPAGHSPMTRRSLFGLAAGAAAALTGLLPKAYGRWFTPRMTDDLAAKLWSDVFAADAQKFTEIFDGAIGEYHGVLISYDDRPNVKWITPEEFYEIYPTEIPGDERRLPVG